jgi:hypothetical protein
MGEAPIFPTFPPKKQEQAADSDMPTDRVHESQLWMARMQNGKEVGFTDPEGKLHALADGESFQVEMERGHNRYDVVVMGADGSRKIFHSGPLDPNKPMIEPQLQPATQENQQPKIDLDKDRLNKLIRITSAKSAQGQGARFGIEISLDNTDIEQVLRIVAAIEKVVASAKTNPQWQEFEKISGELFRKGFIMSGVFPPSWLIDGGQNAVVKEEYRGKSEGTKIIVPTNVYNTYYWGYKAEQLKGHIAHANFKGTSASSLAKDLTEAAHFLRETGQL